MNHTISLTGDLKNISVHKGDTVEIQLEETPTSGYAWEIDSVNSNITELVSNEYKLHEQTGIGGGGKRVMKFIIRDQGNGSIKLKNRQQWTGDIYKQFELGLKAQ